MVDSDTDGATLAAGPTSAQHAAPFNNAEVSAVYVTRLRTQLEELVVQLFQSPADREKVKSVLADLGKTSTDFRGLATKALDTLCGGVMPRLRHVLDAVAAVGYELSEAEYAANEVADTWVQQLLGGLQVSLHWLQPLLTPTNYDTLFHLVLDKVGERGCTGGGVALVVGLYWWWGCTGGGVDGGLLCSCHVKTTDEEQYTHENYTRQIHI